MAQSTFALKGGKIPFDEEGGIGAGARAQGIEVWKNVERFKEGDDAQFRHQRRSSS